MIEKMIKEQYGLRAESVKRLETGAGSNTYFIETGKGKYILKDIAVNEMNNPKAEPELVGFLQSKGIPVALFVKNRRGGYVFEEAGKIYHLQNYIEGETLELNSAPDWFLTQSAQMLGRIHQTLKDYEPLPVGIGESFFKFMTPENAEKSYRKTLEHAKSQNDLQVVSDLEYRLTQLKNLSNVNLELDCFTRTNTHGDYFISQIICGKETINAVIDWTSACVHPVCWEVIRSFTCADPGCKNGEIDIGRFISYVREYLKYGRLNSYDLKRMPYLFYYQIGVCDYYHQYYQSSAANRSIFLHQAVFATKLMRWFEFNIRELSEKLREV